MFDGLDLGALELYALSLTRRVSGGIAASTARK